jgi:hypothetical protein
MQVGRRYGHKINVIRHDFCQLVAVVLGPRVAESLRKFPHSFFVRFRLRVSGRDKQKE